jgi:hypothetical protein
MQYSVKFITCAKFLFVFILFVFGASSFNKAYGEPKVVGRKAAEKYFKSPSEDYAKNTHRLLGLHFAQFLSSKSYKWGGDEPVDKSGIQAMGLTYKMGEWTDSMDLNLRIDYQQYVIHENRPIKLSFLSAITFPDAAANFPIYFGGGIGAGVFISQIEEESPISLDYQLFLGARLVNVIGRGGFFIEYGVKDHLLILSDGQFIGQYLAMGLVFSI